MTRLLLVEDERDLRFSLVHNLEFEGYEVTEAPDGKQGLEKAITERFDLVILDIMMPGLDGLSVLKEIRKKDQSTPVMMLTARSTEMDKVIGFELGADDYLTKPFGLGEFLARVKALLRRRQACAPLPTTVRFLDIQVDLDNYAMSKADEPVHLSQKEFLLLKYLIQRPGQAVEKGEVLNAIWGYKSDATTRTIDTHIAKLRRKLGDQNTNQIIQTVPTVGYKFVAEIQ